MTGCQKRGLQSETPCLPEVWSQLDGMSFWIILEHVFPVIVMMLVEQHKPKLENLVLSPLESYLTMSVRVWSP